MWNEQYVVMLADGAKKHFKDNLKIKVQRDRAMVTAFHLRLNDVIDHFGAQSFAHKEVVKTPG